MDRRSPAISQASSLDSLSQSGSFSPRDSAGPLSPTGATPDSGRPRKVGGGGIQMQIQHLQGKLYSCYCHPLEDGSHPFEDGN